MSNMINRVAQALWNGEREIWLNSTKHHDIINEHYLPFDELSDGRKYELRLIAKTCIRAMREPEEQMLKATCDSNGSMRLMEFTTPEERNKPFLVMRYSWRAMIENAMKDENNAPS